MIDGLVTKQSPEISPCEQPSWKTQLAVEIDSKAVNGDGTGNTPTGILNTTGIGIVPIGTNGGAPTWTHVVDLEGALADANADVGSLGYVTNSRVRSKLKVTEKAANTGQFVWEPGNEEGVGRLNGYRAVVSNNVPSNLSKGTGNNLSAVILGIGVTS